VGAAAKDASTHSTEAEVAKATTVALDKAVPPEATDGTETSTNRPKG